MATKIPREDNVTTRTAPRWRAQARPANSPVVVLTRIFSPLTTYSGTMISMPVLSFAGFGRLVAVAPRSSGAVSTT
jgi:hypothetical protein